jgi:tripartite-type tricarboxylate transporter receptor subunit TctC
MDFVTRVAFPMAVLGSCFTFATATLAQTPDAWPTRPVRILVNSTGGATDIQARLFAQKLSEMMRRQFVVEARPGAGGTIGMMAVARAAPDGYTLLAVTPNFAFAPAVYKNATFDPMKDFAPISLMIRAPYVMVAHPSLPAKNIREYIALARSRPGKLDFGIGGIGAIAHLGAVLLHDSTGMKVQYVPYQGTGPALIDLLGGHVHASILSMFATSPHIKGGKLRAIGITGATRSKVMPDVPTIAEGGVKDFEVTTWHGWAAPAGTPAVIISRLSQEIARVAKLPEVGGTLAEDGGEPVGSTPEVLGQLIASDAERWTAVVRGLKVRAE